MRKLIDKIKLKELVDQGKSYQEISTIMGFTESSLCRCYTKNFGVKEDRAASYRQQIEVSEHQKEIIFGSLFGDMTLQKHIKTYRGSETHSMKQEQYAVFKHSLLKNLCGTLRHFDVRVGNKIYHEVGFSIRPNTSLEDLYNAFYKNGKKDIPQELSLLTPRAMAFWFMDDGFKVSKHKNLLGFSTCCFPLESLLRVQKYLKDKYDIETIIRKNFYLIVKAKDSQKLVNLIKPFMIEEMYYKINIGE